MRIWQNAQGDLLTDDQLLAYVATFESLGAAGEAGDIRLVSGGADDARRANAGRNAGRGTSPRRARLADYLESEEPAR